MPLMRECFQATAAETRLLRELMQAVHHAEERAKIALTFFLAARERVGGTLVEVGTDTVTVDIMDSPVNPS
jgi:ribosome maturation factor RimP